jgi:hypothetical protein
MQRQWTSRLERELAAYAEELREQREDDEIAAELAAAGLIWDEPLVAEVRRHGGPRVVAA